MTSAAICHVLPTTAGVKFTEIPVYSIATVSPTSGVYELAVNTNAVIVTMYSTVSLTRRPTTDGRTTQRHVP